MYDRARFLTVTGDHLAGTPANIEDRTAELALVHARGLIDREPLPDVWCEQCGGPLGTNPVGHKFCSRDCSREASAVASIAPFGTRRGPMQQPQLPLAA
jgi:hypothetical protein